MSEINYVPSDDEETDNSLKPLLVAPTYFLSNTHCGHQTGIRSYYERKYGKPIQAKMTIVPKTKPVIKLTKKK